MTPATTRQHDPTVLRDAIVARLPFRSSGSGTLRWPAIPALLDQYTQTLLQLFEGLGRTFDDAERQGLREMLASQLKLGFEASPFSKVRVDFRTDAPPDTAILYEITHEISSISDEYDEWLKSRKAPLFGMHPDAKVLSLANAFARPPKDVAILDVGAGTGRNTIALAKAGFVVDAVELAPSLAEVLRNDLASANLTAQVFVGDALDPQLGIPEQKYQLVVLAEVVASHFRSTEQLRQLYEQAVRWLAPDGLLLFNAFLASDGYEPDALARQASQVFWCCLFTRRELEAAKRGLPLSHLSDESTYNFEHAHLPQDAWPPTGWFPDWARGYDLFALSEGRPPHELRWVTYRKTAAISADAEGWYTTSASKHIRADWQRVFDTVTDPNQAPSLFKSVLPIPGITQREYLSALPQGPGTALKCTWSDGSTTTELISEYDRPRRYVYRWTNTLRGPVALLFSAAESDWTFTPTPTGTAVYWTYRVQPRHRLLARAINIVQGAFARFMRTSLQSLRDLLEKGKDRNP